MFTNDQLKAYEQIKAGENTALLSAGGCGKSWLINQIKDETCILAAPTGIASLNIGGTTLHSLFNLPVGVAVDGDYNKTARKADAIFRSQQIKTLIIDEISQTRADQFNLIDQRLRKITKVDAPFGNVQVVLVGDPFQISPFISEGEEEVYWKHHKSLWFFNTAAYEMGNFKPAILNEVVRQSDKRQQRILQSVRLKDKWWGEAVQAINDLSSPRPLDAIWLCSYNKQAELINKSRYREVQGKERTYTATNKGFRPHKVPVEAKLTLKVGTKVVIKANAQDGSYQNGTQGVVVELDDKVVWVEKEDGDVVGVESFCWERIEYVQGLTGIERKPVATYTQLPLKLGYGISTHAAQGMTLEKANINFGSSAFASGQAYVALSRVKDLTNMFIQNGLNYHDIIVDPEVQRFYKSLEEET